MNNRIKTDIKSFPVPGRNFAFILPMLYLLILLICYFFNTYNSISLREIPIFFTVTLFIAIIYNKFILYIARKILQNKENYYKLAYNIHLFSILFVISIFINLIILLVINVFAGITFFLLTTVLLLIKNIHSILKIYGETNLNYSLIKKLFFILLVLATIYLNPLVIISFVPVRYEFIDLKLVGNKSMNPTLSSRDIVVIDKISGLFFEPSYNDLIFTKSPVYKNHLNPPFELLFSGLTDSDINYIRRIVAKQGDSINLCAVPTYKLNNTIAKETYFSEPDNKILCSLVNHCKLKKISNGCYYLLGDNINSSQDSRIWSEVCKPFLKGKIRSVIWPVNHFKIF